MCQFNDGKQSHTFILQELGISPGAHSAAGLDKRDNRRIAQSNIKATNVAKKIRQSKRLKNKEKAEILREKEGTVYEAGAF